MKFPTTSQIQIPNNSRFHPYMVKYVKSAMLWRNPDNIKTGTANRRGIQFFSLANLTAKVINIPQNIALIKHGRYPRLKTFSTIVEELNPGENTGDNKATRAQAKMFPPSIILRLGNSFLLMNPAVPV